MTRPPTTHDRPSCADPQTLTESIARLAGADVTVHRTHMSWVVLTPDRAYKLKRPVRLDFADLRDPAVRADRCRQEVALNAELAPGLEVGVRSVVPAPDGSYRLGDDGDPDAIDHVVEMHRFDESRSMRSLVERGELTDVQAAQVGFRLAHFHRTARRASAAVDERTRFDANADALLGLERDDVVSTRDVLALKRFAAAFLTAWSDVLAARFRGGAVVDGHGDVRTDHVLFEGPAVHIVDRLDVDDLRLLDVADELAFLAMDLELHGAARHVPTVLDGYVTGGGARPPGALVAYFSAYRALVRAKVALLPDAEDGDGSASELVALARVCAWRARGPLLLLVTGPPASGKTTLAAALAQASGLRRVSSDEVRRQGPTVEYSERARAAVYGALAREADGDDGVIVDATFGDPVLQAAFFDALEHRGRPILLVECVAPTDVREARAERRDRGEPQSLSDADVGVARVLAERFVGVPPTRVLSRAAVDTTAPVDAQVDEVEGWLDGLLASGRLS